MSTRSDSYPIRVETEVVNDLRLAAAELSVITGVAITNESDRIRSLLAFWHANKPRHVIEPHTEIDLELVLS